MGCRVEKTATGVEIDVHVFDTKDDAVHYVTRSRRYTFERHEPWGFTPGYDFFKGAVAGERASVRQGPHANGVPTWCAAFWIEGNAKVKEAPPVQGQPAYFGYFRDPTEWQIVRNGSGNPISYTTPEAALAGAQFVARNHHTEEPAHG